MPSSAEPWDESGSDLPPSDNAVSKLESAEGVVVRTRGYQAEMLEASLKQNIIVTMDTGSGKTHIAIIRIIAELERSPHTISWFLTPTVWLLRQQTEVLKKHLPCAVVSLSGEEVVEKWSTEVWKAVLDQVAGGVVLSTHQVLWDALAHGFVKLGKIPMDGEKNLISLLIFDEAHHCMHNHPARRIMDDFYFRAKLADPSGESLPSILGLTASPIVRARPDDLQAIERNLDAIAKTPSVHKEELLRFVHPPTLRLVFYNPTSVFDSALSSPRPQSPPAVPIHTRTISLQLPSSPPLQSSSRPSDPLHSRSNSFQLQHSMPSQSSATSSQRGAVSNLPASLAKKGSFSESFGASGYVELSIDDIMSGGDFTVVPNPRQPTPPISPPLSRRPSSQSSSSPQRPLTKSPQTRPRQPSVASRIGKRTVTSDKFSLPSKNSYIELSIEDIMATRNEKPIKETVSSVDTSQCLSATDPAPSEAELSVENIFLGSYSLPSQLEDTESQHMDLDNPMQGRSIALESLERAWRAMEIQEDPYVINLRSEDPLKVPDTVWRKNTYSQKQVASFYRRACYVFAEFGAWCAEMFVSQCIDLFLDSSPTSEAKFREGLQSEEFSWESFGRLYGGGTTTKSRAMTSDELTRAETRYMRKVLRTVETSDPRPQDLELPGALAPKLELLISTLIDEHQSEKFPSDFSGLVFVDQRAGVAVLSRVLSVHRKTAHLFNIGTLLGGSSMQKKSQSNGMISELLSPANELSALAEFRQGTNNLLISTSVGEEGIDIQACAVVVCYNLPQNLKSFIQRRGRARRAGSRCILMCIRGEESKVGKLQDLEKDMKAAYEDDMRHLFGSAAPGELENLALDEESNQKRVFSASKGLLTMDSAVPHLHHFCAVLPQISYVDTRPVFETFKTDWGIRCIVTLPNCLPPELRRAESECAWNSKRRAQQDAAFTAYIQLYDAGLIDEHMLPLAQDDDEETKLAKSGIEKRPSKIGVIPSLDPWRYAPGWQENDGAWCSTINIGSSVVDMLTPFPIPEHIPTFQLHKTAFERIDVSISSCFWKNAGDIFKDYGSWERARQYTRSIFWSVHQTRMTKQKLDFVYCFIPRGMHAACHSLDLENEPAAPAKLTNFENLNTSGIVVDLKSNQKFLVVGDGWVPEASINEDIQNYIRGQTKYQGKTVSFEGPVIEARPFPKRLDYLHRDSAPENPASKKVEYLLAEYCVADKVPVKFTLNALYLPCVIRKIRIGLIAETLRTELLSPCGLTERSLPMICTAISSSAAREDDNYQRLEFLGDSVLKYCTAVQVMAEYPSWHEGLLSGKKDHIVTNSTLARAAVSKNLAQWIITRPFAGSKWRPSYISDSDGDNNVEIDKVISMDDDAGAMQEATEDKPADGSRVLSTKILADVVESLIGACYMIGSFEMSLKCIGVFGLGIKLKPLDERMMEIYNTYQDQEWMKTSSAVFDKVEEMLGYHFKKKALLVEALTHPSYQPFHDDDRSMSYQRLEFLGDAVLDMIVVDELYKRGHEYNPSGESYSHIDMHLYKSAVVNMDFLAFLCMGFSITEPILKVVRPRPDEFAVCEGGKTQFPLWKFVRKNSPKLNKSIEFTVQKYEQLKARIESSFGQCELGSGTKHHGTNSSEEKAYPWVELAALEADKHLSDIMESLIGAVFIDSGGSVEVTKAIIETMGILNVLRRLLRNGVDPAHPVKKLGELAGKDLKTVRYEKKEEVVDEATGRREYECKVLIDEFVVETARGGSSWKEARARAAQDAFKALSL